MSYLNDCRDFYVKRIHCLERFKVRFPPSADENSDGTDEERSDVAETMQKLRDAMVGLMENDVTLMRELIALAETVDNLKQLVVAFDPDEQVDLSPTASTVSLELPDPSGSPDASEQTRAAFYINRYGRQYFSRQNSVLRIPIPPSRHKLAASVGSRQHHSTLSNQSSTVTVHECEAESDDNETSSGVSSRSSTSVSLQTIQPSPIVGENVVVKSVLILPTHSPQGSQDSGICGTTPASITMSTTCKEVFFV